MISGPDDLHSLFSPRSLKRSLLQDIHERISINVRGIIALRWVAVAGQLLTIIFVHFIFGVQLPLGLLLLTLGATATLTACLMFADNWRSTQLPALRGQTWQHLLGFTMLCDLLALTTLLYLTGGMSNPFSLFYFVNIALAAIVLPRSWVWLLAVFAMSCIGLLNFWFRPLIGFEVPVPRSPRDIMGSELLKSGSFIAYATCGSVIVLFITRIRGQIELLEAHVTKLAEAKARNERLDSLGTLAAGAAHELSTPLSTIAVITKEVERELVQRTVSDQTIADISTIRTELDRCRDILDRMSIDAGQVIGESMSTTTFGELIEELVSGVDLRAPVKISMDPSIESVVLRAPLEGLAQAIRGIVKNAVDAAGHPQDVSLVATSEGSSIQLKIVDKGAGIDPETLRRIGEPFFTTKEPGKGMGLGVYLARNVIERLGGTMEYASKPGHGTVVTITIPRDSSQNEDSTGLDVRITGGLF